MARVVQLETAVICSCEEPGHTLACILSKDEESMNCSYCSDEARGIDEDGEPTCGNACTCSIVCRALPLVTEVSGPDNEDEEPSE